MNSLLLILFCFLGSSLLSTQEKKKIFLAGDSTMSIKAVTAYPETGWGMPFVYFWNEHIDVVNKAKNGRSTRTFRSEGLWQSILDEGKSGDYVFIQFGHNDEVKTKVATYTSPEEYSNNLIRFVEEAKEKKMFPVLMTPVARRKFSDSGLAQQTHEQYSQLVRDVAKEVGVPMFDMDKLTMDLYQQFGKDHSRMLFLQLKEGEHPNYPEGKDDNTHFNELGARLVAQIVLNEIKSQATDLVPYMVTKNVKK